MILIFHDLKAAREGLSSEVLEKTKTYWRVRSIIYVKANKTQKN
jgi:hypothetical protein